MLAVGRQREDAPGPDSAAALGTRAGCESRSVERVRLDRVPRSPVVEQGTAVHGRSLPVHRSAAQPPSPRNVFFLNDLTVGGVELSKIGGIEHVEIARLAPAGEQARARAGDQQRPGAAEVEVVGIQGAPVAGREPVEQRQAIGGIELQGAFTEVVDAVVAVAVTVAGKYVDIA